MDAQPTPVTSSAAKPDVSSYISNPFALIAPGWKAFWINVKTLLFPLLLLIAGAAGIGLIAAIAYAAGGRNIALFVAGVIAVIAILVVAIVFAPFSIIVYLAGAKGQKIGFKQALKECPPYALRVLGASLLTGLAVIGGLLLLVIPGIIFGTWFSLASYVVITENLGVIDSMKRSKQLVSGHLVEMWGLSGVSLIGSILPLVSIVSGAIIGGATAIRYLQLVELKKTDAKPPVHWANYLAIVLGLIAIPLNFIGQTKDLQQNSTPPSLEQQLDEIQ